MVCKEFGLAPSEYIRSRGVADLQFDQLVAQAARRERVHERSEGLHDFLLNSGVTQKDASVVQSAVLQWLGIMS